MIHSFNEIACENGNINVEFFEDSKRRCIIFQKGTKARAEYIKLSENLQPKECIDILRKDFRFIKNQNNQSIFRAVNKSSCIA